MKYHSIYFPPRRHVARAHDCKMERGTLVKKGRRSRTRFFPSREFYVTARRRLIHLVQSSNRAGVLHIYRVTITQSRERISSVSDIALGCLDWNPV